MRGTVATSEHAQLRLSLRTQDGGLARSRGLQLDAALDRIRAAMTTDAPARQVLTPAAIAALLRDAVLDAGERRRALRPPDEPAPKPKWAGCTLPRELTRDVIAVAQMADAQLATGMADDISDVPLDASLTARLLDAAAAVVTPVALPVELGASEARSAAFRGRAGLILRDLRRGDLTLGQDSLDRLAAAEGVEVAPENRALAARAAMRALAAAALVGADREQGVLRRRAATAGSLGCRASRRCMSGRACEPAGRGGRCARPRGRAEAARLRVAGGLPCRSDRGKRQGAPPHECAGPAIHRVAHRGLRRQAAGRIRP